MTGRTTVCEVDFESCENKSYRRGLCRKHYGLLTQIPPPSERELWWDGRGYLFTDLECTEPIGLRMVPV